MGATTGVAWTDRTFNGWWGCNEASEGCHNCYARTLSKRWGYDLWGGPATARRITSAHNWNEPRRWDKHAAETGIPERVFAFSMADVFEAHPALDEPRQRFFALVEETPHLRWQLLTKRPEHVLGMVPPSWRERWPSHVWLLTSVENQRQANLRLPWLMEVALECKPPVVGISAEPLLGPIDLGRLDFMPVRRAAQMLRGTHDKDEAAALADRWDRVWDRLFLDSCTEGHPDLRSATSGPVAALNALPLLNWVITGGESGPKHRPMDLDWVRGIRDQCRHAGIAHFFKQVGGATPKANGKELDGREWCEFPDSEEARAS